MRKALALSPPDRPERGKRDRGADRTGVLGSLLQANSIKRPPCAFARSSGEFFGPISTSSWIGAMPSSSTPPESAHSPTLSARAHPARYGAGLPYAAPSVLGR